MRFRPIFILSFFAPLWLTMGLVYSGRASALPICAAAAISAALAWAAYRGDQANPSGRSAAAKARINRIVLRSTGAEWAAIFAASYVLVNTGLVRYRFCAVAIIVGLHFFPLSRIPRGGLYKMSAALLIALGAAGLLMPASVRDITVGAGAACICWLIAAAILMRPRLQIGQTATI